MTVPTGKRLALLFFPEKDGSGNKWKFSLCKRDVLRENLDSNFYRHINLYHRLDVSTWQEAFSKRPREAFQAITYPQKLPEYMAD